MDTAACPFWRAHPAQRFENTFGRHRRVLDWHH